MTTQSTKSLFALVCIAAENAASDSGRAGGVLDGNLGVTKAAAVNNSCSTKSKDAWGFQQAEEV